MKLVLVSLSYMYISYNIFPDFKNKIQNKLKSKKRKQNLKTQGNNQNNT